MIDKIKGLLGIDLAPIQGEQHEAGKRGRAPCPATALGSAGSAQGRLGHDEGLSMTAAEGTAVA